jgi:hypothetical protein
MDRESYAWAKEVNELVGNDGWHLVGMTRARYIDRPWTWL